MNAKLTRRQLGKTVAAASAFGALAPATVAIAASNRAQYDGTAATPWDAPAGAFGAAVGSLTFSFIATSPKARQVLFAVHSADLSKRCVVELFGGNVRVRAEGFESRNGNIEWPVRSDREGDLADGRQHYVTWTVSATGTEIAVSGIPVHWGTSTNFLQPFTQGALFTIGGSAHPHDADAGFVGTIDAPVFSSTPLNNATLAQNVAAKDTWKKWTPERHYSPAGALVNRLPEIPGTNANTEGTVYAQFKTTAGGVQAIVSASSSSATANNFTIALDNGDLLVSIQSGGRNFAVFTVPGHWNDGNWHSVCATVSSSKGFVIYGDGSQIERYTTAPFFGAIESMDSLCIGGNRNSSGEQWKFTGQIRNVRVYDEPLLPAEVQRLEGASPVLTQALFDIGYGGSANYRIPCLVRTQEGTLLATADQRRSNPYDSPNDINLSIRRSLDQGHTWSDVAVVLDYPGSGYDGASAIDSVVVQDEVTSTIWCVVDRFPGGVGQGNAAVGTGFNASGEQFLYDASGAQYVLKADGSVVTIAGAATTYTVDERGNVSRGGTPAGNIHLKRGTDPTESLLEARTSFLVALSSSDDGVTWSQPRDLTHQVKKSWMRFLGTGPGSGIQLKNGSHAGRLLVPVYYNNATSAAGIYSSAVIYTDDHGASWKLSASPNDGRVVDGVRYDSQTLNRRDLATHEATVVETTDGTVVMLMRNPTGRILRATSNDGGATWTAPSRLEFVPDIFSQPNAIRWVADNGDSEILFGNASRTFPGRDGRRARGTGVIRRSADGAQTWSHNRVFRPDTYVYNNLVQLPDLQVGLMWELEWDGIYFSRFPLSWLTSYGA